MRRLTLCDDIVKAIGPDKAAEWVRGPNPAEYRCIVCAVRGKFADGADISGILFADTGSDPVVLTMKFAHTSCAESRLIMGDLPTEIPAELESLGLCASVHLDDGKVQPFVVVEQQFSKVLMNKGESVDTYLASLLEKGMLPVSSLTATPPRADGWRVVIPPKGRKGGGLFGPAGISLLDPMCPVPMGWVTATARHASTCSLFVVSQAGLPYLATQPADVLSRELERAGREGRLIGVTAVVARQ